MGLGGRALPNPPSGTTRGGPPKAGQAVKSSKLCGQRAAYGQPEAAAGIATEMDLARLWWRSAKPRPPPVYICRRFLRCSRCQTPRHQPRYTVKIFAALFWAPHVVDGWRASTLRLPLSRFRATPRADLKEPEPVAPVAPVTVPEREPSDGELTSDPCRHACPCGGAAIKLLLAGGGS